MKYRQDLSLAENAAFALLFFLPWLGIPLLVIRRKRLTNRYGSYHEFLLWALSFGLWLVLCATTSGPIMTLVAASIGSMSIALFLLGIEEARVAKWSNGHAPLALRLFALSLPTMFFQLASKLQSGSNFKSEVCSESVRLSVVVVLATTMYLFFAVKPLVKNRSLLDGYFDEFPDNEALYLFVALITLVLVLVWPLFNNEVPNIFSSAICLI